jgi:hypothetical protein
VRQDDEYLKITSDYTPDRSLVVIHRRGFDFADDMTPAEANTVIRIMADRLYQFYRAQEAE